MKRASILFVSTLFPPLPEVSSVASCHFCLFLPTENLVFTKNIIQHQRMLLLLALSDIPTLSSDSTSRIGRYHELPFPFHTVLKKYCELLYNLFGTVNPCLLLEVLQLFFLQIMVDVVSFGEELMPHRGPFTNLANITHVEATDSRAGLPTTPIRKLSRNRGLVIQEESVVVEDSPEIHDDDSRQEGAIRKCKRKLQ